MADERFAWVFDELAARRVEVGTDAGMESMLGITLKVQVHRPGGKTLEALPELLVPLRSAQDLPMAIQSALHRHFSAEERQAAALADQPSGPPPTVQ